MPLSSGLSVRPGRLSSPLSGRRLDGGIAERPGGLFPVLAVAGRGSGLPLPGGESEGPAMPVAGARGKQVAGPRRLRWRAG